MQGDKARFHSCGMTRVWGSGPFLGHTVGQGPRNLKFRVQGSRQGGQTALLEASSLWPGPRPHKCAFHWVSGNRSS